MWIKSNVDKAFNSYPQLAERSDPFFKSKLLKKTYDNKGKLKY